MFEDERTTSRIWILSNLPWANINRLALLKHDVHLFAITKKTEL